MKRSLALMIVSLFLFISSIENYKLNKRNKALNTHIAQMQDRLIEIQERQDVLGEFFKIVRSFLGLPEEEYINYITEEPTAENCECLSCHGG